ncbi:MAG: hypothetical protein II212_01445, partial [Alistipes sp.]|nr:hypothetical protein [Alistipes sp.]
MKNIFRFWMAVAIICGAVSCAKEDISSSLAGGEVEITFTANLPELGTRAYADGANAGILFYNIYEANTENKLDALCGSVESKTNTFKFQVPMIKGMTYDIVLWAQNRDCGYYRLDGKQVTAVYKDKNANDDTRDAFYCFKEDFSPTAPAVVIPLTRPFAQLNVATSDLNLVANSGVHITTTTVKVKTYTGFNIATGDVTGEQSEITFAATDAPFKAGETLKTGYDYLSMNYILVPKEGMTVDPVYTFNNDKEGVVFEGTSYSNVPLKQNFRTNILGALLTKQTEIEVEILPGFGIPSENIVPVATTAELQKALDEAVANTTIRLAPNVNYGVVYIRPVAGSAATKEVDWQGNNYRWETYSCFEGLTIQGAVGATIDAIQIEGHTYYNTHHSQADKYPVMLSLIELKDVVLDGVTFTGKGGYDPQGYGNAINLSGSNIKVDGLTFKNCVLNNSENKARLLYKTESTTRVHTYTYEDETFTFIPSLKNITITGCTFNGGYMGVELRETENVTITDNEFKVADRNILLPVNSGCTYSGNVTITGNTSYNAKERFVRMSGAGDAVVVIKDNIIVDYQGADDDFIKVTDGNNVTIKNNFCGAGPIDTYDDFLSFISDDTWYDATKTELAIEDVADFAAFIEAANSVDNFEGKTLKLNGDIDLYFKDITVKADGDPATFRPIGDTKYGAKNPFKGTFDGQGHTIRNLYQNGWDLGYQWGNTGSYGLFGTLEDATVKNVVIEGSESYIEGGNVAFIAGSAKGDCVFENITINSGVAATYNNRCGSIVGWTGDAGNYTFKNITIGEDVVLGGIWGSFDSSIGGIVGQAKPSPSATYNFEKITINCRIDAYNDCTASNDYYNYRMCGMIIGRCEETTTIDGKNYPDLSKYNLTFNNVVVNYGDWMNYHYCEPTPGHNGGRGMRVEPGYAYDGLPADYDHSQCVDNHMNYIPFDQLIGGDQYGVKGLREVNGVTVNYPASYRREVSSAAALNEALGKGVSVVLDADIDFGSTQLAITGENQVVDLGGHALTTANNWGGISLKNGATIKNGTITHAGNTAAIKAFNGCSVENVTINATSTVTDKMITGIAVQQGANIESIKNVTINGVSQGIEVGYQATVGLIENAVVNESNNGTAKGIGLVINGGKVGKAKDCTFKGETYGVTLHLKGIFDAGLELENCTVEGTTASIYAWDEKGISNTSGSLVLTYDAATTLTG